MLEIMVAASVALFVAAFVASPTGHSGNSTAGKVAPRRAVPELTSLPEKNGV